MVPLLVQIELSCAMWTSLYNAVGIINNVITPLQMSVDGWNWGAKGALPRRYDFIARS